LKSSAAASIGELLFERVCARAIHLKHEVAGEPRPFVSWTSKFSAAVPLAWARGG
jgi:hypothetical protein